MVRGVETGSESLELSPSPISSVFPIVRDAFSSMLETEMKSGAESPVRHGIAPAVGIFLVEQVVEILSTTERETMAWSTMVPPPSAGLLDDKPVHRHKKLARIEPAHLKGVRFRHQIALPSV